MTRAQALLKTAARTLGSTDRAAMLALSVVAVALMLAPDQAHADNLFNLPVVDDFLCGFISYARGKLAPMVAVAVIILSVIGHWIGLSKLWDKALYVGVGLGVIMGIATAFGRYGNLGASCLS